MMDVALAERIVAYMNELVALDKCAVGALVANRVPCLETLADHPTCQCSKQNNGFYVGLLGVLNGLCGIKPEGGGLIGLEFKSPGPEEDGRYYNDLEKFVVNYPKEPA